MNLFRTQNDLRELAGQYANARRVPAATIIKEILHYEILYALTQSGAASHLVFQGGTALRLCYQGTRYSEDLDFACGPAFAPECMAPFADLLQREIANAYGLQVEINPPAMRKPDPEQTVPVTRWSAKIHIPDADTRLKQNQVINIEVARVPAHDPDMASIVANYPHLPEPLRQMLIVAETRAEILADKLVALGARPFIKARDIWDIKFLSDNQVQPNFDLVRQKLRDDGWHVDDFKAKLKDKLPVLATQDTMLAFRQEMGRFVDERAAGMLANPQLSDRYMAKAIELGRELITDLDNH